MLAVDWGRGLSGVPSYRPPPPGTFLAESYKCSANARTSPGDHGVMPVESFTSSIPLVVVRSPVDPAFRSAASSRRRCRSHGDGAPHRRRNAHLRRRSPVLVSNVCWPISLCSAPCHHRLLPCAHDAMRALTMPSEERAQPTPSLTSSGILHLSLPRRRDRARRGVVGRRAWAGRPAQSPSTTVPEPLGVRRRYNAATRATPPYSGL